MITPKQIKFFETEGFLALDNILNNQDIEFYSKTYNAFINDEFDTSAVSYTHLTLPTKA